MALPLTANRHLSRENNFACGSGELPIFDHLTTNTPIELTFSDFVPGAEW